MSVEVTPLERLRNMGFRKCAEWVMDGGSLACCFVGSEMAEKVLYTFISNNAVLYIGKTV